MRDPSCQAQADAAAVYEEFFVPALFQEWANWVADAAQLSPGERVLDVACGTGVLPRAGAARGSPGGSVAGLDMHPGMLAGAGRIAPEIVWRHGTAESLPYAEASFDAGVSQCGLLFFTARPAALREMVRVLGPGGHLAVAVWGALDATPGYAALVALLQRLGGERAAAALRSPFVLGNPQELLALCANAGIVSAVVTTQVGIARFPSMRSWVETAVKGWLPRVQVVLDERQSEALVAEAERALQSFVTSNGTVEFVRPAHIVTAWKA